MWLIWQAISVCNRVQRSNQLKDKKAAEFSPDILGAMHLVSATDRFLSIGTLIKSTFHLSLLVIKGPP